MKSWAGLFRSGGLQAAVRRAARLDRSISGWRRRLCKQSALSSPVAQIGSLLLFCTLASTGAQSPSRLTFQDLLPNGLANEWTYQALDGGIFGTRHTVRVIRRSGGWSYFQGVPGWGNGWIWESGTDARAWIWNPNTAAYTFWLDLGVGVGKDFSVASNAGMGCWDGASYRVSKEDFEAGTPVGTFKQAVEIVLTGQACTDAGVSRIVFASGFGIVEYETLSILGPRRWIIQHALVDGQEYSGNAVAPGLRSSATLDRAVYSVTTAIDGAAVPDLMRLRLAIENGTGDVIDYIYFSGQTFDIAVADSQGREVHRWSFGKAFPPVVTDKHLLPGDSLSIGDNFELRDNFGEALPPGNYTVEIRHLGQGLDDSAITAFRIEEGGPPSILWIMLDDGRADALGSYGQPWARTPHMDQIANAGVRFETAIVQNPVCRPSRLSMKASLYPHQTGLMAMGARAENPGLYRERVRENYQDLLTAWTQGGIQPENVGKVHAFIEDWRHHGSAPLQLDNQGIPTQYLRLKWHDRLLSRVVTKTYKWMIGGLLDIPPSQLRTSKLGDLAVKRLTELVQRDQPFFLRVSFHAPHVPCHVAPSHYVDPSTIKLLFPSDEELASKPRFERESLHIYAGAPDLTEEEIGTGPRHLLWDDPAGGRSGRQAAEGVGGIGPPEAHHHCHQFGPGFSAGGTWQPEETGLLRHQCAGTPYPKRSRPAAQPQGDPATRRDGGFSADTHGAFGFRSAD